MRRVPFLAALLPLGALLLAALPARAQAVSPEEQLIAPYPAGWVRYPLNSDDPRVRMTRLLPPGQTPRQFTEAIVVERFIGAGETAKNFVGTVLGLGRKSCEGFISAPQTDTTINGYKAVVARYGCTRGMRTGKSGVVMVVAIDGRDALHVVQTMWLGPPVGATQPIPIPDEVIHRWDQFARHIVLCDARDPNHPCPAQNAPR